MGEIKFNKLSASIRLIRPLDWIKNFFLFIPLFFSPGLVSWQNIFNVGIGFILFSLMASAVYVLNDLKDKSSDQLHPKKKYRPLASGDVSSRFAKWLSVTLMLLALIGAYFTGTKFFICLGLYLLLNVAYSWRLKQIALVDIYIIALGFVLRVIAGAVLIDVVPSNWLLICTGLLALFLALAKRRDDVVHKVNKAHRKSISGYNIIFIDISIALLLSALFISYTIYTTLPLTAQHLGTAHFYYTAPIVLFGILRYLQLTLVYKSSGSPTDLVIKDKWLLGAMMVWGGLASALVYWI